MAIITSVCVYCGSRTGRRQAFRETAARLGAELGGRDIRLIYGGGGIGLMGVAADAALAAGGTVIGVIPRHLNTLEVGHPGLSELIIVDGMHARKQRMFELSDAFVVLPGGLGTLDEMFEIITWRQLGLHDKPVFLLDVGGYWQPFLGLIDHIVAHDFAGTSVRRLFHPVEDIKALMAALEAAEP